MSKKGYKTHCGKFGHFLSEEPPAPRSLLWVELQKKWGRKKRKGKIADLTAQSANEDSTAGLQQEKEEEEKEGSRERYFHPAPPIK